MKFEQFVRNNAYHPHIDCKILYGFFNSLSNQVKPTLDFNIDPQVHGPQYLIVKIA